jgi:hypothetical protein
MLEEQDEPDALLLIEISERVLDTLLRLSVAQREAAYDLYSWLLASIFARAHDEPLVGVDATSAQAVDAFVAGRVGDGITVFSSAANATFVRAGGAPIRWSDVDVRQPATAHR